MNIAPLRRLVKTCGLALSGTGQVGSDAVASTYRWRTGATMATISSSEAEANGSACTTYRSIPMPINCDTINSVRSSRSGASLSMGDNRASRVRDTDGSTSADACTLLIQAQSIGTSG